MYTKIQLEYLLEQAREKKMLVRLFYGPKDGAEKGHPPRLAVEGIPELKDGFLVFHPETSWEVLETGRLTGPSSNRQRRAGLQIVPFDEIILAELSLKGTGD